MVDEPLDAGDHLLLAAHCRPALRVEHLDAYERGSRRDACVAPKNAGDERPVTDVVRHSLIVRSAQRQNDV